MGDAGRARAACAEVVGARWFREGMLSMHRGGGRYKGGVRNMRRDGKSPWGCREGVRILRNGGGSPGGCREGVRNMRNGGKSPGGCREGVRKMRNGGKSPGGCREGVRILRRRGGSQGYAGRVCASCAMVAGAQ